MYIAPAHAELSAGKTIFEEKCTRCHTVGPTQFTAEAGAIQDVLKMGKIRQHRFALTEAQISALLDYIKSTRKNDVTQ